jgi:hypothetical protein
VSSLAGHTAAHAAIPSAVTIVLAVAAVGWVLWSRMKGQPLQARRLLVLPVVLTVLGITDLTGSSAPRLTPKDIGFLIAGAAIWRRAAAATRLCRPEVSGRVTRAPGLGSQVAGAKANYLQVS